MNRGKYFTDAEKVVYWLSDEDLEQAKLNGFELPAPGWVEMDKPPPEVDVPNLSAQERAWRDIELSSVMWLRERHRDQLEIGTATTLAPGQFTDLLTYIQALRDWPQSPSFPDSAHRPIAPAWLDEQVR